MRITTTAIIVVIACAAHANGIFAQTVLVDFGVPDPNADPLADPNQYMPASPNWNIAWYIASTAQVFNDLIDDTGAPTDIDLTVAGMWSTDGPGGMDADNLYPYEAQKDFIGCSHLQPSTLTLAGLTEPEYTIKIFGSRLDTAFGFPLFRKGQFTIGGDSRIQDHAGNTTVQTVFANIAPVGGEIVIDVVGFPDVDTTTLGFAYVNVMEVIIPEPSTLALLALSGLAAVRRRRR